MNSGTDVEFVSSCSDLSIYHWLNALPSTRHYPPRNDRLSRPNVSRLGVTAVDVVMAAISGFAPSRKLYSRVLCPAVRSRVTGMNRNDSKLLLSVSLFTS